MSNQVILDNGNIVLWNADCLDILPTFEPGSVEAVIADPPYGCNKAPWDTSFPSEWYPLSRRLGVIYVITGGAGVADSIRTVGGDFVDCIAARNMNSRTRSAIGFSNSPNVIVILSFIPFLGGIIVVVALIWTLIAGVIAVRQALRFSTWRAIGTCIVGWIIYVAVLVGPVLVPYGIVKFT